jgi:hypothetical protein
MDQATAEEQQLIKEIEKQLTGFSYWTARVEMN